MTEIKITEGDSLGQIKVDSNPRPMPKGPPPALQMNDRIKKTDTQSLDDEFFEGKFEDIIERMNLYRKDGWDGIEIKYNYESTGYQLYKERWETEEEYKARKAKESSGKERRRKKYEELKREFET